jgi:hypothetical protein
MRDRLAIYSDETRNLQEAASRLEEIKRGRLDRKHLLFAITATLHQRDSHMSATIKRSLKKSKAKVEHIRDRIDELEGLTVDLRRSQGEITREYNHLCLIYPNNPYVARAYSSFLYQIANDEDAGDRMMYNSRQLRLGKRPRIERSYFFASRLFANLPSGEKHSDAHRAALGDGVEPHELDGRGRRPGRGRHRAQGAAPLRGGDGRGRPPPLDARARDRLPRIAYGTILF